MHGKWKSEPRVLDGVLLTDLVGFPLWARLCWAAEAASVVAVAGAAEWQSTGDLVSCCGG